MNLSILSNGSYISQNYNAIYAIQSAMLGNIKLISKRPLHVEPMTLYKTEKNWVYRRVRKRDITLY